MCVKENLKNTPIIFLDIDHVLTNTDIDNTSFLNYDPTKYHISDYNLKYLNMILDKTNAKIVIASNWRKFTPPNTRWLYDGKWYESPLSKFQNDYKQYIIDMLPPERHITKAECLELWCEDHQDVFSKITSKYVILEDDIKEEYQNNIFFNKHLILIDYHTGLTENNAIKAIEILKGDV